MRLGSVIAGVGLLVLGGLGGYLLAPRADDPVAEKPRPTDVPKKTIDDKGASASLKALRAQIRDLEARLAAKDGEIVAANALAANRPSEPGNFRERMERMKKEDPERYTQMTNRMAQWRQRRAEQQKVRMEFFSSIDTSHMDSAARIVHTKLQELTANREELEQQLHNENLTDDERHELWDQMREVNHQIWSLNEVERKNLIEETARNLGFTGEDVMEFSATIQDVIEATDGGFGPPRGHRGQGGPGGR